MAPLRKSTDCLVETLTTASMTCSATSAIPSGPRAAAGLIKAGTAIAAAANMAKAARPMGAEDRKKGAPMGVLSPGIGFYREWPRLSGDSRALQINSMGGLSPTSSPHQPDHKHADNGGTDPDQAQGQIRGFQHTPHRPLGSLRKRRKYQAFNDEN